ncbi:MAG TPA: protein translocase subunit SecF [Thermococcus paralvinellae]|uniref:Protein-export membrane protein SecF n=1 Tax=Thermococcus paralvinellae TaxID=582419 RepID=A0A832ZHF7_9EURY|nr:protein translocase subunit SecF [Thermococcus paralvinellae]
MIKDKLRKLTEIETKKMIIYPLAVFFVSLLILAVRFPQLGIDLKGGVVVTAYGVDANPDEIARYISQQLNVNVKVEKFTGIGSGINVYAPADVDPEKIREVLEQLFPNAKYAISEVQPTFGAMARRQGIKAIFLAFLGMAIVVFLFFRVPVPSFTVIFSAFSDMVIALALMGIFGIELSQATIAALLMLIGYSVDSNILLTTRLLKRKEDTVEEAYFSAVSTGFTMSTTTLGALASLWLFSTAKVIDEIAIVLIFGLLADFMNTWILNAGVLRWVIAKKEEKEKGRSLSKAPKKKKGGRR